DRLGGLLVDVDHVVSVDLLPRHPVGGSSSNDGTTGGRAVHRHRHPVLVVLAHEHHRQIPDRGQVQRFVEGAFVGGSVAEEAGDDAVAPLHPLTEGGSGGDGHRPGHDSIGTQVPGGYVGDVHRTTPAPAVAGDRKSVV